MKTKNYSITLPNAFEHNRDIIFNEALIRLDSFCNIEITDFISDITNADKYNNYIIKDNNELMNHIYYYHEFSDSWQKIEAKNNMFFLCNNEKNFFLVL